MQPDAAHSHQPNPHAATQVPTPVASHANLQTNHQANPPSSTLRLLSPKQTAAITTGALTRLTRPLHTRVLIAERSNRLFALHVDAIRNIQPRLWNSDSTLGHIPELKLPTPLKPFSDSSRDIIVQPCGVLARLGVDRIVTTHRLDVAALADPQELIPSGWLLGYFDLSGTTVAMIDPAALLPVRHCAPFAA